MPVRVGSGFDAHRLTERGMHARGVMIGGVEADPDRSVVATSDGDVVAHAVGDALLGAVALGDLGEHFPADDPQWRDADTIELLSIIVERVVENGHVPTSVDVTVVAESVRVAAHRTEIRRNLADVLQIAETAVSVKATTTDGMGFLGNDEGIAAMAVVVVTDRPES